MLSPFPSSSPKTILCHVTSHSQRLSHQSWKKKAKFPSFNTEKRSYDRAIFFYIKRQPIKLWATPVCDYPKCFYWKKNQINIQGDCLFKIFLNIWHDVLWKLHNIMEIWSFFSFFTSSVKVSLRLVSHMSRQWLSPQFTMLPWLAIAQPTFVVMKWLKVGRMMMIMKMIMKMIMYIGRNGSMNKMRPIYVNEVGIEWMVNGSEKWLWLYI